MAAEVFGDTALEIINTLIRKNFLSESLTEKETRKVIHKVYKNYKILIDPHTAVAVGVMDKLFIKEKTLILSRVLKVENWNTNQL